MRNIATTRILHAPESTGALGSHRPWIWPLPRLDGAAPRIVGPVDRSVHDGVDLGYPDCGSSPGVVPVLAARDGVITYAGITKDGPTVCIDHAGGWSTQYANLDHVLAMPTDRFRRRRKTRVRTGDVLGHARRFPLRVRFGLARLGDSGWSVVDPTELMHAWAVLPWRTEPAVDQAA